MTAPSGLVLERSCLRHLHATFTEGEHASFCAYRLDEKQRWSMLHIEQPVGELTQTFPNLSP